MHELMAERQRLKQKHNELMEEQEQLSARVRESYQPRSCNEILSKLKMSSALQPPQEIQSFREEIARLNDEQDAVMKRATSVGMTSDEAKEFDMCRERLIELYENLIVAEGASHNEVLGSCAQATA